MAPDARGGFSAAERARLLAVKDVGPTVLARLEQVGITSLAALADAGLDELLQAITARVGGSCWRNSPQARRALTDAIAVARQAAARGGTPR